MAQGMARRSKFVMRYPIGAGTAGQASPLWPYPVQVGTVGVLAGLDPSGGEAMSSAADVHPDSDSTAPDGSAPALGGQKDADTAAGNPGGELDARDAGMSTVEYAVGTVVAAAFAAVLYKIVTGDSVVAGLTNLINSALSTTF